MTASTLNLRTRRMAWLAPVFRGVLCLSLLANVALSEESLPPRTTLDFNLYAEGRYVYERNCLICHGERGDGKGELSKDLQPPPRSFREGWFKFRSTAYDKLPTDDDLRRTITGGLSGTAMGKFSQLSTDEVTAVIEYVKSFSRRWRKVENYGEPMPQPVLPVW
ncbi:MAG: c-type cytochrome, partial [Roseimicrobium sp.]